MKACEICNEGTSGGNLCPRCERLAKLMSTPAGLEAARKLIAKAECPPWEPFYRAMLVPNEQHKAMVRSGKLSPEALAKATNAGRNIFKNNRYQVILTEHRTPNQPTIVSLSIRNLDQSARHDWRDFQRIKNELLGPGNEAIELYPAEARLVDTANQFWLWCSPGMRVPFGFPSRLVATEEHAEAFGAAQRPFEPGQAPADAIDLSPSVLSDLLQEWQQ